MVDKEALSYRTAWHGKKFIATVQQGPGSAHLFVSDAYQQLLGFGQVSIEGLEDRLARL